MASDFEGGWPRLLMSAGRLPLHYGRRAGELAVMRLTEVVAGKPMSEEEHITERIRKTRPAHEARVGQQFIEIADLTDPSAAESSDEERDLELRSHNMRQHGHAKIARALGEAATGDVADDQLPAVLEIADKMGTDPARLAGAMPEDVRLVAQEVIEHELKD